ncbi:MAG: FAD-dependent oxidoreductase [Actinobacteria bacterium 69-20]|nr:FAD-dependent oxidoreductase [Actinomycetota bacterium]OJV29025.1 MAG: FAD-dependent oxidoreductase [Actinobacteria bacterium 69-20]
MSDYRSVSLWLDQLAEPLTPRAALAGDIRADIAIVGAGFTGLWTAYYLQRADPSLTIVVLEKEIAGFGASGRNGGWCSALFPTSWQRIAREHSKPAAMAMRDAMRGAVAEVGDVARTEGIDCDYHRGGTLTFVRNRAQLTRARAEVAESLDSGDDDVRFLDSARLAEAVRAPGMLGATFTPHCAAIDPAKLVRGLADLVVSRGVTLYERTPALSIAPHQVVTAGGVVTADSVIRATEAFTVELPGRRRDLAPIYSLIVATEPLGDKRLADLGLADRPTFADHGNVICYGQRTASGRIVFGGRGAPYHFGSSLGAAHDRDLRVFARLRRQLVDMFPSLHGVAFTHAWGGAVAAPRDWHASVLFDPATRMGSAGGYVGDGVSTTNLAGRTLANLVMGDKTALTTLPWVGHTSRKWEPEPLRWLGVNAGLRVMTAADWIEAKTGRPSRVAAVAGRLLGE